MNYYCLPHCSLLFEIISGDSFEKHGNLKSEQSRAKPAKWRDDAVGGLEDLYSVSIHDHPQSPSAALPLLPELCAGSLTSQTFRNGWVSVVW